VPKEIARRYSKEEENYLSKTVFCDAGTFHAIRDHNEA
jgi:hypothetical protein